MARYRYLGVLRGDSPPDRPVGIIRVRSGLFGRQIEESFTRSLKWERTERLSPLTPPEDAEFVEMDESAVRRFIDEVTQQIESD